MFTSSQKYLGCHPLSFFWELVSGEIIRPVAHQEHAWCHKHDIVMHAMLKFSVTMGLTHMGGVHFWPVQWAWQFILSLFVNSLLFVPWPIISPVAMASGEMEGICLVLWSSAIVFPHLSSIKQCEDYKNEHIVVVVVSFFLFLWSDSLPFCWHNVANGSHQRLNTWPPPKLIRSEPDSVFWTICYLHHKHFMWCGLWFGGRKFIVLPWRWIQSLVCGCPEGGSVGDNLVCVRSEDLPSQSISGVFSNNSPIPFFF